MSVDESTARQSSFQIGLKHRLVDDNLALRPLLIIDFYQKSALFRSSLLRHEKGFTGLVIIFGMWGNKITDYWNKGQWERRGWCKSRDLTRNVPTITILSRIWSTIFAREPTTSPRQDEGNSTAERRLTSGDNKSLTYPVRRLPVVGLAREQVHGLSFGASASVCLVCTCE